MFEATCGILQLFTNNLLILTKVLIEQIQKSKVLEIKDDVWLHTNETENYIGTDLSHKLLQELGF
jgi:hypothetical protein